MNHIEIRPRASPPDGNELPKFTIVVKHPAYRDEFLQNEILELPAWDTIEGGLHAYTVLIACGLLACNRFDGFLTRDREGNERLDCDNDLLLPTGQYYFHVPYPASVSSPHPATPYKYPLCPAFRHWSFPHGKVPQFWYDSSQSAELAADNFFIASSVSAMSSYVIARDGRCSLSGYRDILERAHLCPKSETEWFEANAMNKYNKWPTLSGNDVTCDTPNAIALRSDLHKSFDQKQFVIIKKGGQWVAHFLRPTSDLGREYHNRPIAISRNVAAEFLLTRFAWALFPRIDDFLRRGGEKLVKIRQETPDGIVEVEKSITREDVAAIVGRDAGRGRSASPKKRRPDPDTAPEEEISAKRQRVEQVEFSISRPPALSYGRTTAGEVSKPPMSDEDEREQERLDRMRKLALKAQRPSEPSLICCDYAAREEEEALGLEGRPLCIRCMGIEFMSEWHP